jgi:hypothetical protein
MQYDRQRFQPRLVVNTGIFYQWSFHKRVLIGSTYRCPCIDRPCIDLSRLGSPCRFYISICHVFHCHVPHITRRDDTITLRIQLPSLITPSTQCISSQIQVHSRDLPDHTRWIITRLITVIHLTGPRFPPVEPPYLPVAPRIIQTASTSSLYKPCHTPDSWCGEEVGSLLFSNIPRPIKYWARNSVPG